MRSLFSWLGHGLVKFQKWSLEPAQTFAMAQAYVEEHLDCWNPPASKSYTFLGLWLTSHAGEQLFPSLLTTLQLLITSSEGTAFKPHNWYDLDEPTCSTPWKRTWSITNECIFHLVPSSRASLEPKFYESQTQWESREGSACSQKKKESRRWITVQIFSYRTLKTKVLPQQRSVVKGTCRARSGIPALSTHSHILKYPQSVMISSPSVEVISTSKLKTLCEPLQTFRDTCVAFHKLCLCQEDCSTPF